jgi:hypothetical protein
LLYLYFSPVPPLLLSRAKANVTTNSPANAIAATNPDILNGGVEPEDDA